MESTNNIDEYFLGILYSSNYKDLSIDEQKKMLIEKKIYTIEDNEFWILYNLENYNKNDLFELGSSFFYLNKSYKINDLFLKELYEYVKADVYASVKQPLEIKIKEICQHAKHIESFSDVNEFYKSQYREQYERIKDNSCFLLFNEPEVWNYPDWECYVIEEVNSNSILIETHLFSEYGYSSFEEISKTWQDLYYYSEVMNFLREKLNKNDNTSLSKLIFKENGEEIFNYIVLSYQEEKKQAFYNYLYYFLKDNLKIIKIEDEQSDTYKSYVIKKGFLKEYGRMQKARSTNKKTHNRMMNLFQEMYSQKFEKTMSKSE